MSNAIQGCFVGVDFGKTNVRFGVAVEQHELRYFTKQSYLRGSPEEMHRLIVEGVERALKETGYNHHDILGIGIDVPAVVNRETGAILWGPDWDFMGGVSLTRPIAEYFGVPVVADVDTVTATWGEHWAGSGKTCDRFAVLTWGTGLGAGLVIDGEVQEYPDNLFPEFGHSRVSDDDWLCLCGAKGCVDAMVSGCGIAKHGRLAVQNGRQTLLRELCVNDPEKVTSHMVFEASEAGDEVAAAILKRVAILIGRLCANLVLTMQPEKIVIVGGLADRCGWVLDTINQTMRDNCWLLFKDLTKCEVIVSSLGDTVGVLGAICKTRRIVEKQELRKITP